MSLIYVVVEQFGAENIPLLSGRLVIDLEPQITGFSVESETTCIGRAENIQDWKVDYGLTSYGFADCSEGLDGWVKMDLFSNKYVTYVKILAPPDGR